MIVGESIAALEIPESIAIELMTMHPGNMNQ